MSGLEVRWTWEAGFNHQMTQPSGKMVVASVKNVSRKSRLATQGLLPETPESVASATSNSKPKSEQRRG